MSKKKKKKHTKNPRTLIWKDMCIPMLTAIISTIAKTWSQPECPSTDMCMCVFVVHLVAQSCPTLCDPIDCSTTGSSVHGILQARILEWAAMPFSRGSSQPRDQTQGSCLAGRFFTIWVSREAIYYMYIICVYQAHSIYNMFNIYDTYNIYEYTHI